MYAVLLSLFLSVFFFRRFYTPVRIYVFILFYFFTYVHSTYTYTNRDMHVRYPYVASRSDTLCAIVEKMVMKKTPKKL